MTSDRLLDDAARTDRAIDQPGVGTDLGTFADHGGSLQQRAREERDVGRELHRCVDVGPLRIEHGDPEAEPSIVRALTQHRFGSRELPSIVHSLRLFVLVGHDRDDRVTGVVQHLDDVGQVVLPLVVLGSDPAERGREHAAPEAVDRRVPFGDREHVCGGVTLLDDTDHVVVLAAHDAAVSGGVGGLRGQDRARRTRQPVLAHERCDGGRSKERRIAGEHDDVAVVVVVESREPDAHGVAGAPLHVLLDEVDDEVTCLVLQLLRHHLGTVPDDDDRLADLALGERVEHVEHHRPSTQQVQRLRSGRPHASALAGGEHDGGQPALGHHVRSTPTGLPVPSHGDLRSGAGARTPIPGTKALCPANWTTPECWFHLRGHGPAMDPEFAFERRRYLPSPWRLRRPSYRNGT